MTTSAISICSAALLELGDSPISAFNEPNKRATQCANLYPLARLQVLRDHPWNCAIRREVLAPLVDAPAHSWAAQFQLPADCVRLLQVGEDADDAVAYQLEGRVILANRAALPVVYVADVVEAQWDALLTQVMTKRMVKDLAYAVTGSASLAELKAREYDQALRRARSIDGLENPPQDWADSPFIAARGRGPMR